MKRCKNFSCVVGYTCSPRGAHFLGIDELLAVESKAGKSDSGLRGYNRFEYCPDCGNKVSKVIEKYNKA